ncbi:MAG: SPW repeat domain-containing protein [Thermoplasmatota archaeon]
MSKVSIGIETSSWINIVAGFTIAIVAWYQTTTSDATLWSGLIAGAVLVVLGAYTAWAAATARAGATMWASWLTLVAGVWLLAYPFFVTMTNAYYYTSLSVGLVVGLVSAYEIYAASKIGESAQRPPTA